MSRDCCVALPSVAMGLSAVCYCGISWSYSLTIFVAQLPDKPRCLYRVMMALYFSNDVFFSITVICFIEDNEKFYLKLQLQLGLIENKRVSLPFAD